MNSYKIGLIDEDSSDLDFIKRTILVNKPKSITEEQIVFWEAPLPTNSCDSLEAIINDLVKAITDEEIQILIVDYKIVVSTKTFEGTDIFKALSERLSKFPLIMLSNLSEDCYSKEFVDADKVYSKREFFKIESDYSKEKVANIFRNMDKYSYQRAKLTTQLAEQLGNLEADGYSSDSLRAIVEIEKALGDFTPQDQNTVEKALDMEELKEAVDILKHAQGLIGDGNEA